MKTFKEFRQNADVAKKKLTLEAVNKKTLTAKEKRLKKLRDLNNRPESWKNLR